MPKWFGPSLDGMKSCVPRTWQAWVATLSMSGVALGARFLFHPQAYGLAPWYRAAATAFPIAAYLLLVYLTYDPEL